MTTKERIQAMKLNLKNKREAAKKHHENEEEEKQE
jgi:hypothetical protein